MMKNRSFVRALCLLLALLMTLATGCAKTPPVDDTPSDPPTDDPGDQPGGTPEDPPKDDPTDTPKDKTGKPTELRINLLSAPFGVDKDDLSFSWVMNDDDRNEVQTEYRITIAKTVADLAASEYVYNSGWVSSSNSTAVREPDLVGKLNDNELYYWQVALCDATGATAISDPQAFTTAVGKGWASSKGIWAGKSKNSSIESSTDWTDYQMDVEFVIDSNAVGFILRSPNKSNFYMWQFKVEGTTALLCPHVYKDGKFVNNAAIAKINVPAEVAFGTGDMIYARIVCDGDMVETYIKDKSGDYVLVDERDMSEYGMSEGVIGLRTGGSESGKIRYMNVRSLNDEGVLYESGYDNGENPFGRCTIENGALIVPKGLSTGDMLDPTAVLDFLRGKSGASFVFLRTELALSNAQMSKLDRAVLSVTATSPETTRQFVYNMYVNGTIVGVGPSRYGQTPDGATVLYYNTYDVTSLLTAGDNCLATINYAAGSREFLSQLTLYYTDGTSEIVSNSGRDNDQWTALPANAVFGMSNSIGTTYYLAHANNIDSSLYPHGFATVGFDDSKWMRCHVSNDPISAGMVLAPSQTDNVSRYVSEGKVTVKKLDNGDYVIDLGAEIVGGLRFTIDLAKAATIKVYYGEQLNDDGTVKYQMNTTNVYEETWKLVAGKQTIETIDMMTYRYIQISGCPAEVTPEMVQGLEIRAPFEEDKSYFTSDSTLLNDIYELMKNTIKMTTQDLFVDSQSRERLAYEGDLIINLLASYAFGNDYSIGRFSAEYLYTHRTWPAEYFLFAAISALDDYKTTGDIRSLEAYYDVLKSHVFTQYLDEETGLLTSGTSAGPSAMNAVLIDWPTSERDGYDDKVKFNTVLNAVAVGAYDALAEIAELTGHASDADEFYELADTVREAMMELLYDSEKGAFADGLHEDGTRSTHYAQHATAYALAFGIYENQAMADDMAATIAEQGEIRTSVYGAFFLLKGLYTSGNGAVANALLLNDDVSSGARTWAYMLYALGATITTEAWNSQTKSNMTLSHPWGAAPAYAIVNGIFGINPTGAGYSTFDVRLQTEGLNKASLVVPTIKGEIAVSFEDKGYAYLAEVTVPANTQATVYIPAEAGAVVTVNGETVSGVYKDGFVRVTVGSGTWAFEVK